MNTGHFFLKLIGPRPDFAHTMDDNERALMQQHASYCAEAHAAGRILNYGPVFDPAGSFGMAVVKINDLAEVQAWAERDPSISSGMNRYEVYPMVLAGG